MERKISGELQKWKGQSVRKPLVIEGARQLGKTYIMKEFGNACFEDLAYFSFDGNDKLQTVFENDLNPHRIIEELGILRGKKIEPDKTLIIFDEIQECGMALSSMKYFCEDAPQYYLISAGSLLGTYLAGKYSYPVGKVDVLRMFPLTFEEFLQATDNKLFNAYNLNKHELFHNDFIKAFQRYLIIGGLPECVQTWLTAGDISNVIKKQEELQIIYERDFTKHNVRIDPAKILMIFRNIPAQLAKENKKFVYGDIGKGQGREILKTR